MIEVEELKWDRIHPPYRTPVPNSRETNGSCSSSSNVVLDTLEKSDQLGSKGTIQYILHCIPFVYFITFFSFMSWIVL